MSFKEYAEHRGVTPARISQAVTEGKLTPLKDENGKRYFDPEIADRQWTANTDEAKQIGGAARGKPGPSGPRSTAPEDVEAPASYMVSRAKREHFKALIEEAVYRERIGALVLAEDVSRQAFEDGRVIRQAVLGVPDRIAPQLAAETDPNRIHAMLTAELVQALEELDRKEAARAAVPGDAIAARAAGDDDDDDDAEDLP